MKSATDAFEDAEIAREGDRNDLAELIPLGFTSSDPYSNVFEVADAILAAGFTRQSPASTTAADLSERVEKRLRTEWPGTKIPARFGYVPPEIREGGATDTFIHLVARVIREEVAAPEGDGGNE